MRAFLVFKVIQKFNQIKNEKKKKLRKTRINFDFEITWKSARFFFFRFL